MSSSSSSPFVKICGLRTSAAAMTAANSGADMLGLIFAPSKRQVSLEQAQEIVRELSSQYPTFGTPAFSSRNKAHGNDDQIWWANEIQRVRLAVQRPLIVGVFADQSADFINEVALRVPLDLIQLHGQSEPITFPSQLNRPCLRALHVLPSDQVETVLNRFVAQQGQAALCLLDTGLQGAAAQGGTGKAFDWKIASELAEMKLPFLLAGGLNADTVQSAIQTVHPFGVDVSSGVEDASTGQKDLNKIHSFVLAAKTTQTV